MQDCKVSQNFQTDNILVGVYMVAQICKPAKTSTCRKNAYKMSYV